MRAQSKVREEEIQPIVNAVPTIITGAAEESAKAIVQWAEVLARKLKVQDLGKTQVRSVFDELCHIESLFEKKKHEDALHRLHLLKPRLIYQTARISGLAPLVKVLERAIDEVVNAETKEDKRERFRRLMEFAEAVVAYHKAYGGE